MKKIIALVIACIMTISMFAMVATAEEAAVDYGKYSAENPLELHLSHFAATETNQLHLLAAAFKEKVEAATGGAVLVDIEMAGAADKDSLEQVISGVLDMAVNNTPIMSGFYDKFQILDLPYLFQDYDMIYSFLASDACQNLMAEFGEKTGARMLCMQAVGYRNLESSLGFVHGTEDISKIKTRCTSSDVYVKTWETWGANVQTLSGGEVMPALQQGTIDACDNVNNVAMADAYYQEANYITLMEYAVHFNGLTINNALFQGLTPDLQAAISQAAIEAAAERTKDLETANGTALETMMADEEFGVEVYEMTEEEKVALKEAAQPVYDFFFEKFGAEDVEAIQALAK